MRPIKVLRMLWDLDVLDLFSYRLIRHLHRMWAVGKAQGWPSFHPSLRYLAQRLKTSHTRVRTALARIGEYLDGVDWLTPGRSARRPEDRLANTYHVGRLIAGLRELAKRLSIGSPILTSSPSGPSAAPCGAESSPRFLEALDCKLRCLGLWKWTRVSMATMPEIAFDVASRAMARGRRGAAVWLDFKRTVERWWRLSSATCGAEMNGRPTPAFAAPSSAATR